MDFSKGYVSQNSWHCNRLLLYILYQIRRHYALIVNGTFLITRYDHLQESIIADALH